MNSTVEVRTLGGRAMRAGKSETPKGVFFFSIFFQSLRGAIYVLAGRRRGDLRLRFEKVEEC